MNILIFNWQDIRNPLSGGAEVHMHEIFSRVAKMGHAVTLFCSAFDGAPPEETIDGITVIREGGRFTFSLYVPFRYLTRFRHERYDVVIDNFNKLPFLTPLYVRKPLYFIIHHLFGKAIFRETSLPVAALFYCAEAFGILVARLSRVPLMVVSPSTRDEMIARHFPPGRIEIVYNCVDQALHQPDPSARSRTPLIGYFGRLKRYKSVDDLLRAFALVRHQRPGTRLVIVGEGDHRAELERLANDLGIAPGVEFTGYVDEGRKVALLREMWFLANPSSKEGWGLTVIEANACGTPVVASNVPGLRDAIKDGETGILYPYGDVNALASAMIRLLDQPPLRAELAANALAWARSFDWNVAARRAVELLAECAQVRE
jgi:glycosyltransferase involved in cell wall biosynthesis